jgi:hypothetical protein
VRAVYAEFYLGGVARALSPDGSHDPELAPVMERRADADTVLRVNPEIAIAASRMVWPLTSSIADGAPE